MGCKKMDEGGRTVPLGIFFFPVSEAANNFDKRTLAAVPSLGRGRKKNNIHTTAAAHRSSGVDRNKRENLLFFSKGKNRTNLPPSNLSAVR